MFTVCISDWSITVSRADCGGDPDARNIREFTTMLTIICPNCRHRFPAPVTTPDDNWQLSEETSKEEEEEEEEKEIAATQTHFIGGILVPRGYISDYSNNCLVNKLPTTIRHESAVFQTDMTYCESFVDGIIKSEMLDYRLLESPINGKMSLEIQNNSPLERSWKNWCNELTPVSVVSTEKIDYKTVQHVATTCEFTGGSVTITRDDTAPDTQFDGSCAIESKGTSYLQFRSKLTGSGCFVQKRLSIDDERPIISEYVKDITTSPSGCSGFPGNKGTVSYPIILRLDSGTINMESSFQQKMPSSIETNYRDYSNAAAQSLRQYRHGQSLVATLADSDSSFISKPIDDGLQILQVKSTIQLPMSLGQCKINVTSTTSTLPSNQVMTTIEPCSKNSFNGGGIVKFDVLNCATNSTDDSDSEEHTDNMPTTPVSWLMPCTWNLDAEYLPNLDKDAERLNKVKRVLQTCGWYHEGITCQQSASLLEHTPVGRWLMRDSSDKRYLFAVSVRTARGSTSIRIHYFLQQFRLDAEPRLALTMPLFDCPIKMLEYYVEFSKKMDKHPTQVWVNHSRQLYDQIYLTKPLIKEVSSLSHLARLVVNRNKLSTKHLPLLIRKYLAEYPYTL